MTLEVLTHASGARDAERAIGSGSELRALCPFEAQLHLRDPWPRGLPRPRGGNRQAVHEDQHVFGRLLVLQADLVRTVVETLHGGVGGEGVLALRAAACMRLGDSVASTQREQAQNGEAAEFTHALHLRLHAINR